MLTNGNIIIIAGTGRAGYNGILAINAQLNEPKGITVNSNNEIYIADSANHRIRKILNNGTIITIAGSGNTGNSLSGALAISALLNYPTSVFIASNGEVYFSDSKNLRIRKILKGNIMTVAGTGIGGYSSDNILAVNSKLNYPQGLAELKW